MWKSHGKVPSKNNKYINLYGAVMRPYHYKGTSQALPSKATVYTQGSADQNSLSRTKLKQ